MTVSSNKISAKVCVTKIRSELKNFRNKSKAYGKLVSVDVLSSSEALKVNGKETNKIALSILDNIFPVSEIHVGSIYEVEGTTSEYSSKYKGFKQTEITLKSSSVKYLMPRDEQIVAWLSANVRGIAKRKAQRLYDILGQDIYTALNQADHDKIKSVIKTESLRESLFQKWSESGDSETLIWCQEREIPVDIVKKAFAYYQRDLILMLEDNPYRLLAFDPSWQRVDRIAIFKLKIGETDIRRLTAALEEVLYKRLDKGDTCVDLNSAKVAWKEFLITTKYGIAVTEDQFEETLKYGLDKEMFYLRQTDGSQFLHTRGSAIMETQSANFIKELLQQDTNEETLLFDLEQCISDYENREGIKLNSAQALAIKIAFTNKFSVITGGAGVGKTTVLKGLYRVLDSLGSNRFQMSLSGRATQRMIEATGEDATTIASFLSSITRQEMGRNPIIVIDEASMLDLNTFYRLTKRLPKNCHMILVGDPYQLPPIGAGLILHALTEMQNIPIVQLTEVKRQHAHSMIPLISEKVREGSEPEWVINDPSADVTFVPCSTKDLNVLTDRCLELYGTDPDNSQILAATNQVVQNINLKSHEEYTKGNKPIVIKNSETNSTEEIDYFREGDLLVYMRNDWDRGLQNGSLGKFVRAYDEPQTIRINDEGETKLSFGQARFEGRLYEIYSTDLDYIEHSYAITVHKAQGSQFKRVIIPIKRSQVLDRTFIYTAITRATEQVVIIGDIDILNKHIIEEPKAFNRQIGLTDMLKQFSAA